MAQRKVIIIDDFYRDPMEVRQRALNMTFANFEGETYPGKNSTAFFAPQDVMEGLAKVAGGVIHWGTDVSNGLFRLSSATATFKQDIHYDTVDWSGIAYLNTPEQYPPNNRGGSVLWRHKASGTESYDEMFHKLLKGEWRVPSHPTTDGDVTRWIRKNIIYGDGLDRSLWDELIAVPPVFNRVALFRSSLWHSHDVNFGTTPADSRLIQTFFFNEGPAPCRT
jgi:hypothetical protein